MSDAGLSVKEESAVIEEERPSLEAAAACNKQEEQPAAAASTRQEAAEYALSWACNPETPLSPGCRVSIRWDHGWERGTVKQAHQMLQGDASSVVYTIAYDDGEVREENLRLVEARLLKASPTAVQQPAALFAAAGAFTRGVASKAATPEKRAAKRPGRVQQLTPPTKACLVGS